MATLSKSRSRKRLALSLIELLVVIAILSLLIGLLLPAVQKIRARASRLQCENHLRQIGIATHHYEASHRALPAGVTTRPDVEQYSSAMGWHTRLLPFIEQEALWKQSMDAFAQGPSFLWKNPPHVGFNTVISLYVCPSEPQPSSILYPPGRMLVTRTNYLGVNGTNLYAKDGVLFPDSSVSLAQIPDGTSNTLLVGEKSFSTDPRFSWWYAGAGQKGTGTCDMLLGVRELREIRDLDFADCPIGPYHFQRGKSDEFCDVFHFWSFHSGGGNFLFADGSVHFLDYSADSVLPALATRNGGEAVGIPD